MARRWREVVDFLGIHTYPAWEEKTIDEALDYTIENIEGVRAALPGQAVGHSGSWLGQHRDRV